MLNWRPAKSGANWFYWIAGLTIIFMVAGFWAGRKLVELEQAMAAQAPAATI